MSLFKDIPEQFFLTVNEVDSDYKGEVVASSLVEKDYDPNYILLIRKQGDKRFVSKDINHVYSEYSTRDLMEYLYIYTNRTSIYDAIPEGVFHQPLHTSIKKTHEGVLEEIRRHREEEFFARRFFQPFEMIVDQLLVDVQLYEHRFNKKNFHTNLVDVFSRYWEVLQLLSLKQAVLFVKVLPVIYRLMADFKMLGKVLSMILDTPIHVSMGKKSYVEVRDENTIPKLGKWNLGITTTIGRQYEDGYKNIAIEVGPVAPQEMKLFENNAKSDLILHYLLNLILPINCFYNIKYKTLQQQAAFLLSHKEHKAYLGINTVLKQ